MAYVAPTTSLHDEVRPSPYMQSIMRFYAENNRPPLPDLHSDTEAEYGSDEDEEPSAPLRQGQRAPSTNNEGMLEIPNWNPNKGQPLAYEAREETSEESEVELREQDKYIFLPVRRRQALPPESQRSGNKINSKSKHQHALRVRTLRNQIRVAHGVSERGLVDLLEEFKWDINKAAAAWRAREERLRRSQPDKPLFEELDCRRGYRGLDPLRGGHRASVPESRMAALFALAVRLSVNHADIGTPLDETNATMVLFLQRCQWDLDAAERGWKERAGDMKDFRKAVESLRTRAPTLFQKDERLRELVSLTSTDSIEAARQFLQKSFWDFAAAVDKWIELGFLPIVVDRYRVNQGFRSVSVEYMPDNVGMDKRLRRRGESHKLIQRSLDDTPLPPFEVQGFACTRTLAPLYKGNPPDYMSMNKRDTQDGFIIDYDPDPKDIARLGCPDPTKLRMESIRRGEYIFRWVQPGQKITAAELIRFRDTPDLGGENESMFQGQAEFNWNSKRDITQLNVTINQRIKTIEGRRRKEKCFPFHWYENQWIWNWMAGKYEQFCQENEDVALEDRPSFAVNETEKVEMAAEFNKAFCGKTVVDGVEVAEGDGAGEPRPFRGKAALTTQRNRVRQITTDFNLSYSGVGRDVGIGPREERESRRLGGTDGAADGNKMDEDDGDEDVKVGDLGIDETGMEADDEIEDEDSAASTDSATMFVKERGHKRKRSKN
ncbi:MAG: hypothetical protein Q9227_000551 [Pyrenula ochraceoflavens]